MKNYLCAIFLTIESALTLIGLTQKPSQTLISLCPLRLVWYALRARYALSASYAEGCTFFHNFA